MNETTKAILCWLGIAFILAILITPIWIPALIVLYIIAYKKGSK